MADEAPGDPRETLARLRAALAERERAVAELTHRLVEIERSLGWRGLTALRRALARLAPGGTRRARGYLVARRLVEVLADDGPRAGLARAVRKVRLVWRGRAPLVPLARDAAGPDRDAQYARWLARHPRDDAALADAAARLGDGPLISVVVPVCDPEAGWLEAAIASVRRQAYPRWQLCLVDDASTRPHVGAVLASAAAADPRILATRLAAREGIAAATNRGLALATGELVAFLDHDDELAPEALLEIARRLAREPDLDVLYSDEDKLAPDGRRVEPFFKPDWSPDLLLSTNYLGHLCVYRRALLDRVGGLRPGLDGSQDHDLALRASEHTTRIGHVPRVLYHWRQVPGSAAARADAKPGAREAGRRAVEEALRRRGLAGRVEAGRAPGHYAVRLAPRGRPLVTIVVPTRDRAELLRACLTSIETRTRGVRHEVVVVDNDSREPEAVALLAGLAAGGTVVRHPGSFNFSAACNQGARAARGDVLVFLNNDVQVAAPDWLVVLTGHAQRPEVGAVGAKLLYPTGRLQHAGVVLGIGGLAGHAFKGLADGGPSYFGLADLTRNVSAVTGACLATPRRVFEEVGGFDEGFRVGLGDVDLCLRLGLRGYLVIYAPQAVLYHHEGATRGRHQPGDDERRFRERWGALADPYYSPHLTLAREDWSLAP